MQTFIISLITIVITCINWFLINSAVLIVFSIAHYNPYKLHQRLHDHLKLQNTVDRDNAHCPLTKAKRLEIGQILRWERASENFWNARERVRWGGVLDSYDKKVLLLENVFNIKNQFDKKIAKNKQNNYALLWKPFHFKGRKMFFHWKFVEIVSKFRSLCKGLTRGKEWVQTRSRLWLLLHQF